MLLFEHKQHIQSRYLLLKKLLFKGALHPFALSFVSLETQSYFWMVKCFTSCLL